MQNTSGEALWVYRMGGIAAIVGSVLGLVGNLIHPVTPIDDPLGVAEVIEESQFWVPIHLAIVFGIALMLGGLVAIRESIRGGAAGALARFGLVAAIVGTTVGLVLVILDGVGAYQLAQEWGEASMGDRTIAVELVHLNETLNFALASLFNFSYAAWTFILFGLAVALTDVYPRWLGWVATFAGAVSLAAGTIQAAVGEPTDASRILTIIGPTLITLWLLVMGILLLRKARDLAVAALEASARSVTGR